MADFFKDNDTVEEKDSDIITLFNEATEKEEEFYHLATIDVDKRWYIVMKPVEKLPDIEDDEVLIYEILTDEEGNDYFAPIEDEKLLEKVFNEFDHELDKAAKENGWDLSTEE
ncbi:MAG TPA: DUF1292 domain-containing protein [Clostridia bacterium]|nr:DUF1292 domain-containing protein [Clostridia bacterium]